MLARMNDGAMRNALILHGTNGTPDSHWFPWLAGELRAQGYEDVRLPALPHADRPNLERYWAALQDFPFGEQTVIVGHSSGATMALRILEHLREDQHVRCVVAVAPFHRDEGFGCNELVASPFDWEQIRRGADQFLLFSSPDDPFVTPDQVEFIAKAVHVGVLSRAGSGHFSTDHGGGHFNQFPEILQLLDENHVDRAWRILRSIKYATIATASPDGEPWNTPVYAAFDADLNIYWASDVQGRHSQNIADNPRVLLAIYDSTVPEGTGQGVYVQAAATALDADEEIYEGLSVLDGRVGKPPHPPERFSGSRPRRVYRAVPQRAWVNEDGERGGEFIDIRVTVPLDHLRERAQSCRGFWHAQP